MVQGRRRPYLSGGPLAVPLAALVLMAAVSAAPPDDPSRAFLISSFAITPAEFDRLAKGQVVARNVPATDGREIATLGVVRVRVTPEFYVARLTDIVRFKQDEAVLQIGVFGTPPALADVAGLTLDDADIRSLRGCRVGKCGLQLPADAINRFRQDVDWRRSDAKHHANGLMRQILVEYVTAYQLGAAAAMHYADQSDPMNLRNEFTSLAASGLSGWDRFPALRRHLVEYPRAGIPAMVDLLYWSKEDVGRKSVASVTHLAISRTAGASAAEYAVASKQIYGTHYYDASLGLTVLLRDHSTSGQAIYVAYVNRSRIDILDGMLGGLARRLITAKARSTVSDQLARLQRTLERQYAAPAAH